MILRVANALRKMIWYVFGIVTVGVRVMIISGDSIMLIQHSYKKGWFFPGGGIKRGESLDKAARREVLEELGVVVGDLRLFGAYTDFEDGRNDQVVVFLSDVKNIEDRFSLEIVEGKFFPLDMLPSDISPWTRRRVCEYLTGNYPNYASL